MSEKESSSSPYFVCLFTGKTDNFDFFGPNLPNKNDHRRDTMCANFHAKWTSFTCFAQIYQEMEYWGLNFKNLSVDLESVPLIYHVCQFSGKTDNFEFFHQNFEKLPNYMWCFGSNNVEGVAKNSAKAEMTWVEVGPWFNITLKFIDYISRATLWQKTVL